MTDYDHELWYELYRSALMELEHSLMAGRIKDARAEVLNRVEKLKSIPGLHAEEKQAIEDAVSGLRSLEHIEAEHVANEALQKLRSLEPKLRRLKLDPNEE
jgi:hypothetical protein